MNRKLNIKFIKKLSPLLFDMLICPILLYGCEIWEPYLDLNYDKWYENPIEYTISKKTNGSESEYQQCAGDGRPWSTTTTIQNVQ